SIVDDIPHCLWDSHPIFLRYACVKSPIPCKCRYSFFMTRPVGVGQFVGDVDKLCLNIPPTFYGEWTMKIRRHILTATADSDISRVVVSICRGAVHLR